MGITTMEACKGQTDGQGTAEKQLAEMVVKFDDITKVQDWPGGRTETVIYYDDYFGKRAINYIKECGYEIRHVHTNTVVVEKTD